MAVTPVFSCLEVSLRPVAGNRRELAALLAPRHDQDPPARRARRVGRQPRVNAAHVEPVVALRQDPHLVPLRELAEADGALHGEPGGARPLEAVHDLGERLQRLLLEPPVGRRGGPRHRRRRRRGAGAVAPEPGAAGDGHEADHADQSAEEDGEDDHEVGLRVQGLRRERVGGGGGRRWWGRAGHDGLMERADERVPFARSSWDDVALYM